ncbi:MAG: HAD-IC family P-type ATPase, partial [candidate division Zixibacteria bacterium]
RDVRAEVGLGMAGECSGRKVMAGNRSFMEGNEVSFGQSLLIGEKEMDLGRTVVYVSVDEQVVGILGLADRIRNETGDIITYLKSNSMRVIMLSGDNRRTVQGIATSLEMDHYEAEISPEQKKVVVESFGKIGYKTAMVGDGINDAPAMATASIGVAIGSGTDIASEAADVILVRSNLMDMKKLFDISRLSLRTIRQNLFWALIYNVIAIPVAAGLFYPLFGLSLSPMLAAFAMSLSSVFVVTNSLRLSRIQL